MNDNNSSDREESKAKWSKLIEEFQVSGQNQTNFCKGRGIKKDLKIYMNGYVYFTGCLQKYHHL